MLAEETRRSIPKEEWGIIRIEEKKRGARFFVHGEKNQKRTHTMMGG
jgi:hypothetical protein